MELQFTKMHGAGNDFIMIQDLDDEIELSASQVRMLCDRHFGIGADGVILVKPSTRADAPAYMDYRNSDGTVARMCGNGVRCFAKFLVDRSLVEKRTGSRACSFVADTLSGPRPVEYRLDMLGRMTDATVDMGEPDLAPADVPTSLAPNTQVKGLGGAVVDHALATPFGDYRLTCVSMGNPHAVAFVVDPSGLRIHKIGPFLEEHEIFPEKANIEFARVERINGNDTIYLREWERGCGETLAGGTGACAALVAANLTGRAGREATVALAGGDLLVKWDEETNHVFLTGPATESFSGTVTI